ncbi:MAG: DUF1624 domain-containing protein [Candidatus Omnitrophica bacterium]|nr:DUF1624 domain-containing protein [Candidatus Omnitrophota bacterium]
MNETTGSIPKNKSSRIISLDVLRGAVIIIMALDHIRDFFSRSEFNVTDLAQTTVGLFLTRVMTHYCAPIFIFLAGTSAFLYKIRGRSDSQLAKFLFTRGIFLVILELTVVRLGLTFNVNYFLPNSNVCQVIWAIGWSMIALSLIIRLPLRAIIVLGAVMIVGHNLFDGVDPTRLGYFEGLWTILHVPGVIKMFPGMNFKILYPLVPWIGVMALGYTFGNFMLLEEGKRRKIFFWIGTCLILIFIALRASNFYGDALRWSAQKNHLFSLLSFLNVTKYPPSLLYLLMTLGPAILILSFLSEKENPVTRFLVVFGRVPLFFYVAHLFVIHAIAIVFAFVRYGQIPLWLFKNNPFYTTPQFPDAPSGYGYSLPVVYLVWVGIVMMLFPLCRWYVNFKKTHKSPILSYI